MKTPLWISAPQLGVYYIRRFAIAPHVFAFVVEIELIGVCLGVELCGVLVVFALVELILDDAVGRFDIGVEGRRVRGDACVMDAVVPEHLLECTLAAFSYRAYVLRAVVCLETYLFEIKPVMTEMLCEICGKSAGSPNVRLLG